MPQNESVHVAAEVPDDVEPTDEALKTAGILDDVLQMEKNYLDEQRVEEEHVAEADPEDAGKELEPVDEDTSAHVIEADETQVDLPDPEPEPGDAD